LALLAAALSRLLLAALSGLLALLAGLLLATATLLPATLLAALILLALPALLATALATLIGIAHDRSCVRFSPDSRSTAQGEESSLRPRRNNGVGSFTNSKAY
jgi:hypothetical protein